MKAIDYLKAKARMTNKCGYRSCNNCLLGAANNGKGLYCDELEEEYPEKAIEIVEKWALENSSRRELENTLRKFLQGKIIEVTHRNPIIFVTVLEG